MCFGYRIDAQTEQRPWDIHGRRRELRKERRGIECLADALKGFWMGDSYGMTVRNAMRVLVGCTTGIEGIEVVVPDIVLVVTRSCNTRLLP